MNKLLVITVLVALLALNAESFRVSRQAEDTQGVVQEEVVQEKGTLAKFTDTVKTYYSGVVNTANEYLENIKGMKLEEKAKNLYTETTNVVTTYAGIMQDQIYHGLYQK
ncbi:apolipoprotein C-II [Gymnodraco acuticeps]|uniref:Apolipoprotein C-II n=1 Tax=Gymnodraco acuticeps TaxID=8218 RepID=A0A6P8WPA9_GYMAC|nr:apolipoprotein C-II [Gymnodraco acuticeps]